MLYLFGTFHIFCVKGSSRSWTKLGEAEALVTHLAGAGRTVSDEEPTNLDVDVCMASVICQQCPTEMKAYLEVFIAPENWFLFQTSYAMLHVCI